jgi:alpha-glucuronidase
MYNRQLIDYLPPVVKIVREYQAIMHSEQPEIDDLFAEIQIALDNQFIHTATEYGVRRWEELLNIVPKATSTLDERKFTILLRLAEKLPFTYRVLQQLLNELCGENGYTMQLNHNIYELTVIIGLASVNNFNDVKAMLRRVVPANLTLDLLLDLNKHITLRPFTHQFLNGFTHKQLQTEEF